MKRVIVLVVLLLTTVQLLAQTQYDYYEGGDAYGGVDTAITGFKIIGIIVLIIAVILIIAAIYGSFAGWFKKDDSTHVIEASKSPKKTEEKSVDDIFLRLLDLITITGKTIEVYYTRTDGKKFKSSYWYEIETITYNRTLDIKNSIGIPVDTHISLCEFQGESIEDEDIIHTSICHSTIKYWNEKQTKLESGYLHLRQVYPCNTKLYDIKKIDYGDSFFTQDRNYAERNLVKY